MSHTVDMRVSILDLEALKASCEPLGLEFLENKKTHRSYSPEPCDHAIRVKGNSNAYEIGVQQNKVGRGWTLKADAWQGGHGLMDAIGGISAPKIKQEYALQLSARKIPRGFRTQRVVTANGHVQLRCSR
jgi:hypothetical protein